MTLAPAAPTLGSFRLIAADIKLSHSVFAMPFALLAAVMAAQPRHDEPGFAMRFGWQIALIVLAMIFARTAAMLANRLIDRHIDARNPRTASRALPSGRLAPGRAAAALAIAAAGFILVCACFGLRFGNWWPLILSLPVLLWITAYGYLKRFTALCHFYLGSSLAMSPVAAAIAIEPATIVPGADAWQPAIWLLCAMVLCWVAGFDIIYALQDVEIDRAQRLHSMPARFGAPAAIWISRTLHAVAALMLLGAWQLDARLDWLYLAGVGVVIALLLVEHLTVSRWGTMRIALAFFTLNGLIACALGILGIADVMVV